MTTIVDWIGSSGATHRYWALDTPRLADTILEEPGNYVFVRQLPNGNFVPLYFGETENLRRRIPDHEVWPEALRAGVTHVMAHTKPSGEHARLLEEADLIAKWNPPLNVQHRTVG